MYRDELEAARARILELEERVRALEAREKPRPPAGRADGFAAWAPLAAAGTGVLAATLLAMADQDAAAARAAITGPALALLASAWSWGRAHRLGWLLAFSAVKLGAAYLLPRFVQSIKALSQCGTIVFPEQCLGVFDLDYYLFWYAPLAVFALSCAEFFALRVMLSVARAQRSE